MPHDPAATELFDIAASTLPLPQRATSLLESLDRCLAVDGTWLALSDPQANVHATVGSTGLGRSVLEHLDRPCVSRELQRAELNRGQPAGVAVLPFAVIELPTWAECLVPAGFREGLAMPLFEPDGPYLGMLTVLLTSADPPPPGLRDRLRRLAPVVARGVSPMRSLLLTARLVAGATSGVVLFRGGGAYPLPGLQHDPRWTTDPAVLKLARRTLQSGRLYRSFLWPTGDDPSSDDHVRLTVLAATDVPDFVLGTLLVTPAADCRGLTPRELEVLGLLVRGCSNQQIATRLVVAPRTVAAHVEHILHKLDAPTRTQAAVLAEREGCYVPWTPQGSSRSGRPHRADG